MLENFWEFYSVQNWKKKKNKKIKFTNLFGLEVKKIIF